MSNPIIRLGNGFFIEVNSGASINLFQTVNNQIDGDRLVESVFGFETFMQAMENVVTHLSNGEKNGPIMQTVMEVIDNHICDEAFRTRLNSIISFGSAFKVVSEQELLDYNKDRTDDVVSAEKRLKEANLSLADSLANTKEELAIANDTIQTLHDGYADLANSIERLCNSDPEIARAWNDINRMTAGEESPTDGQRTETEEIGSEATEVESGYGDASASVAYNDTAPAEPDQPLQSVTEPVEGDGELSQPVTDDEEALSDTNDSNTVDNPVSTDTIADDEQEESEETVTPQN